VLSSAKKLKHPTETKLGNKSDGTEIQKTDGANTHIITQITVRTHHAIVMDHKNIGPSIF